MSQPVYQYDMDAYRYTCTLNRYPYICLHIHTGNKCCIHVYAYMHAAQSCIPLIGEIYAYIYCAYIKILAPPLYVEWITLITNIICFYWHCHWVNIAECETNCALATPHDDIDLGQHWLWVWLGAVRYQTITWCWLFIMLIVPFS